MDFEKCKQAFEQYMKKYDRKDKKIRLKYIHTYKVVDLMERLSLELGLSKEDTFLAKVIGLLHDIGRFEQIDKYHVIDDEKSHVNHAEVAVNYLFEEGHIRDFLDIDTYDEIIKEAILNHNRYKIEKVRNKSLLFAKMIRDMDKVDIFRVCASYFELKFDASSVSPKVMQAFEQQKTVHNKDRKSPSDEIVSTLSFVFDINFNESYDLLASTDNFLLFVNTVEVDPKSEEKWEALKQICIDKINKGIGE